MIIEWCWRNILEYFLLLASLLHLFCLIQNISYHDYISTATSNKLIPPSSWQSSSSWHSWATFARLCLCFSATSKAFVRLSRILSLRVSLKVEFQIYLLISNLSNMSLALFRSSLLLLIKLSSSFKTEVVPSPAPAQIIFPLPSIWKTLVILFRCDSISL